MLGTIHSLQLLKVFPGIANVDQSSRRRDRRIDITTITYVFDVLKMSMKAAKLLEFLTHALEKSGQFTAAQLELLNYVADLLESVDIALLFALVMGDDQERGSLEQQNFIGLSQSGQNSWVHLQLLDIGNQLIDNTGPGFVERFHPRWMFENKHTPAGETNASGLPLAL